MFDLTSKIKLEPILYKRYVIARIFLYLAFLGGLFFVADSILLPSITLDFFFNNSNSLKNSIASPKIDALSFPDKGLIPANKKFTFDETPLGNFSNAETTFTLDKNSKSIENVQIGLHKSYKAFLFPEGKPAGFKNGTLLNTKSGEYYIVSEGKLRKFSNNEIASTLGYPKSSFFQVSQEDLLYNDIGENINDTNTYPSDTLFQIEEAYYKMIEGELVPFVSERAFLSQYETTQAIVKSSDFLVNYTVSENPLGFAEGTLASFDISAFILSEDKSYPIINPETFISMGFNWEDVVALDSEEIGIYDRQKLFTRDQPHPNGTLFVDQKTNEYFIIENGSRRPIKSAAVKRTYKQKPVIASLEESKKEFTCNLKKEFFGARQYSCKIPLDEIEKFSGNNYQFQVFFPEEIKIDEIKTTFSAATTWQNIKSSLSDIKKNLQSNYTQQPQ